tara:strand:- start:423 stop:1979 length:1557 start_codon:yes stop_codon:yes gene_type:complete
MPRYSLPKLNSITQGSFEPNRKNPVLLRGDESLDETPKVLKVGEDNTPLEISNSELRVNGDLFLNGKLSSHTIECDSDYLEFRPNIYTRFESSNYPGNLDLYVASGDSYFLTSGTHFNFLSENAGTFKIGSLATVSTIFTFDVQNTKITISDDTDTGDKFDIVVAQHGATSIFTTDDDAEAGHLTIFPDGDLKLTPKTGVMYLYDSDNADDYLKITVGTHGATEIQTYDVASGIGVGYDASLKLVADGDLTLHGTGQIEGRAYIRTEDNSGAELTASFIGSSIGGNKFHLYNRADSGDYFQIKTLTAGTTIISTTDDGGAAAHLKFEPDGSFLIKEVADAGTDVAGYGQLWIHDTTPNELCFTDDAGTDIVGIGKYHYETKFIGYYGGSTYGYLPMTGYILEQSSTSGRNEYISFLSPYNGTIEKVGFRSEVAQDGALSFRVSESSDGTEIPGSLIFRGDTTVDIADDIYQELTMTSPSVGSDYCPLTKGKIYNIYLSCASAPQDTNIIMVFKWDITS